AFFYSLRTAALPFLFIFNTDLLLIDVGWAKGIFVFITATIAMLLFAAATQGWFLAKNRFYESIALLLIAFTLFRPGFWMDMVVAPFENVPPAAIEQAAMDTPVGENLRLEISGLNAVGDPVTFTALLPVGEGDTGKDRLFASGLEYIVNDEEVIIDNVTFGSPAAEAGFDWDQKIEQVRKAANQPSKFWMFLPALALLAIVVMLQRGRARPETAAA
ncbi:MAG: DUF3394 domain-containing protein, partial [Erythrobacter sp.]